MNDCQSLYTETIQIWINMGKKKKISLNGTRKLYKKLNFPIIQKFLDA